LDTKLLKIAVIGLPNAGKSTLINKLLQAKITITSPRPQTTRVAIKTIFVESDTQVIFIDTPGILTQPKDTRQKAITKNAWVAIDNVNAVLILVDTAKFLKSGDISGLQKITKYLAEKNKQIIVALNKIDAINHPDILQAMAKWGDQLAYDEIFPISAKNGKGVEELKNFILAQAEPDSWIYDKDQLADINMRFMAEEIAREKLFYLLRDELPFAVDIKTNSFKEDGNYYEIHQTVYTQREAHKRIIIGKGASLIKKVGTYAREELEKQWDVKVGLYLHVKVTKGDVSFDNASAKY